MVQYKKLTGKSDEELQRIFEKEMRLGVLSTQNLLYPFPGMQRPVMIINDSAAEEAVKDVLDKFNVEDEIQSQISEAQMLALDALRTAADSSDEVNFTWEADNEILNSQRFWEEYLVMSPMRELKAKAVMAPCPRILLNDFHLVDLENSGDQETVLSIVCPTNDPITKTKLELIMRNIRDLLRIRGFWVRSFDDPSISEELRGNLRDGKFRVEYVHGCTVLHEISEPHTGALLVTNAQNYDELPLQILQDYRSVHQSIEGLSAFFYKTGIEKNYISADGLVLDDDLYEWYFQRIFEDLSKEAELEFHQLRYTVESFIKHCIKVADFQ